MPSIANYIDQNLVPEFKRFVEVKEKWSDEWELVQYLFPIQAVHHAAPNVDTATIGYHFGDIQREDQTSFSIYTPQRLRDWFIRITILRDGASEPTPIWTGIVVDDELELHSQTTLKGDQTLHALGLEHLLNRRPITSTYVSTEDNQPPVESGGDYARIDRLVTFNLPAEYGHSLQADRLTQDAVNLKGNRTENKLQENGQDTSHVFAREGHIWGYRDICEYLLERFPPDDGPTFKLVGALDALQEFRGIVTVQGKTVLTLLNELIDHRNGLGFYFDLQEDICYINVDSVSDVALSYGIGKIPANSNQVDFTVPTAYPHTHLLDSVPFHTNAINTVDRVEVWGEPVMVFGTFGYRDGTLVKGWNSSIETDYKTALGSNAKENDIYRSEQKFRDVFTKFVVPEDWGHDLGETDGDPDGPTNNVAPTIKDDGSLDIATKAGYFNQGMRFEDYIPLYEGWDYRVDPPTDLTAFGQNQEYRPIFAVIKDTVQGWMHKPATDGWCFLDRISEYPSLKYLKNVNARALTNQLGVQLDASPNHYMANTSINHGVARSETQPELNYQDLVVSLFWKTSERFKIVIKNPAAEEGQSDDSTFKTGRIKIIRTPFELWYAAPRTVIDVDQNQDLVFLPDSYTTLRDEREQMERWVAFVKAWYGRKRQATTIGIDQIGIYVPLMAMIKEIKTIQGNEPIRTVVSSRVIDFANNKTILSTGWGNADFAPRIFV